MRNPALPLSHMMNWLDISDTNGFQFSVRSCSNALIELRKRPTETELATYSIILGTSNTTDADTGYSQVIIRDDNGNGVASQYFETPNVLNCHVFRRLWLSWRDDIIEVHVGTCKNV